MKKILVIILMLCPLSYVMADEKIVNVYAWTGEVPDFLVKQFEDETKIKVNFSTYENNEIMYAKLRAVKNAGYDVIMPSSYFVDRMRRQNMILPLDKNKLPNFKNLSAAFVKPIYDPQGKYCVPFIWGVTGMFYNDQYFAGNKIKKWSDLWDSQFINQLMMLDDMREVFSMTLLTLGYSPNDKDPAHIKEAFLKLKKLTKNIKVFSTDTVVSILIDEDASIGMAWNGDTFKASQENAHVKFIFPEDGFVIWVDNFAIPINAPHQDEAYAFINFMLRPEVARAVALYTNFAITNYVGQQSLPLAIRTNPVIYPSKAMLSHGQFQNDVGDNTLALFEKYWEEIKMSG